MGGTVPYTITWQDGSNGMQNDHVSVGTPFEYTVVDNNGCHFSGTVNVSQPEPLEVTLTGENITCFGSADGRITASVTGGTPSYSYVWSNGGILPTAEWLSPGTYRVTVTDSHSCTAASSTTLTEPQQLSLHLYPTDVQCGYMLGSISSNVSGGTMPYTYAWSNSQSGESIASLPAGGYTLTVSDARGCQITSGADIRLNGGIDAYVTVSSGIVCPNDANAVLEASSQQGAEPLTYSWNNGQASPGLDNVGAGTYTVTITDSWGCTGSGQATVQSPEEITVNITTTDAHCHNTSDGTITVNVSGGSFPYGYVWSETAFAGNNVSNAHAGTYSLTVTDSRGCESYSIATVGSPDAIVVTANVENISCHGKRDGIVEVSAEGGTEPYIYSLFNGYSTVSGQTTYHKLPEGGYEVTAMDVNGCQETISIYVVEPAELKADLDAVNPSCRGNNDGQVIITAQGGTEPYMYGWSEHYSDQPVVGALYQGEYTVSVVDANKCTYSASIVLEDSYEDCLKIPNVFTPNGDGINDDWEIGNIDMFPKAHIYVFNRWGQMIYNAEGSDGNWNGDYRGHKVPAGTYMYIIDLHNGAEPYDGTVTIIY
jgi:gliding motility-associated-like protein